MKSALPIIAIVGRPNVGKSTLFNRLIGVRYAITSRIAGTTRDRVYHEADFGSYKTIVVDTGGLDFETGLEGIEADVQLQARVAIEEADVILFCVDGTEGLTRSDFDAAQFLRAAGKPIVFAATKSDVKKFGDALGERMELGLGEPLGISAIHSHGLYELEEAVIKTLKKEKWKPLKGKADLSVRIAFIGKPNVGKSSIVNEILNEKRLIVSSTPGTTVDTTDTHFKYLETRYVLMDTAGMRRRARRGVGIEKYSSIRSIRAVSRCDVAIMVLDYGSSLANQDLHVCQYVLEAGKGLIVAVNKSDLMDETEKEQKEFSTRLGYRMDFASWAPVVFTSALRRKNLFKLLELAKNIAAQRLKKVPEKEFVIFVRATVDAHPPIKSGQKIFIYRGSQTSSAPPEFTFITNKPDLVHFSYRRYLENEIRRRYGFFGTPIRICMSLRARRNK